MVVQTYTPSNWEAEEENCKFKSHSGTQQAHLKMKNKKSWV